MTARKPGAPPSLSNPAVAATLADRLARIEYRLAADSRRIEALENEIRARKPKAR